jgi:hypothetical protein
LKQRTELANVTDSDVIGAFLASTSCQDLVSKLGCKTPTKANELMDIATKFTSGQEAVEALFHKDKEDGKRNEGAPEVSAQCNMKKGKKKKTQQGSSEALAAELVSHPALRNKARCISYMRQEDNIYNNRVYRDKCHNNQSIYYIAEDLLQNKR